MVCRQNKERIEKMELRRRTTKVGNKNAMIGDEPLTCAIRSRLIESDYEKLKQYCDRNNLKISALLRELVENFLKTVPDQ
jgi:hypothetical protein